MPRYAISDIHGCFTTFKSLLQQLEFSKKDELYLLGDYIDRGPDSKGVIDHIWYLQKEGYKVFCLKGNHEQMLILSLEDNRYLQSWRLHGGRNTLESFGSEAINEIPKKYLDWIDNLPYFFEVDEYILVHAGLNFKRRDPMLDRESMMWARAWYHELDKDWLGERIIVHGHTPIEEKEIKQGLENLEMVPALNIDNGCVYEREGFGQLCAFDMDAKALHFLSRKEF